MKYNDLTLGTIEAVFNKLGGLEGAQCFLRGEVEVVRRKVLTLVRKVSIAAQPAVTTSEEWLKEAGIGWMGDNFKAQFLGLEVPATEEAELAVHKLEVWSLDDPIIKQLGGKEKAEIAVSQLVAFLAASRGSSEWFIAYLKGRDGNLWAVDANWVEFERYWSVEAYSVGSPVEWFEDDHVLSRDF